ncbi:unnamed protein product, partial [Ectocarpus fasciculatus]
VWNRRKQQWIEVDVTEESPGKATAASPTSSTVLSSNAYASGVNQNAGNFLTDKPITRIHAPPGGASSISFGDQHTGPAAAAAAAGVTTKTQDQQGLVLGTPTQPTTPESAESKSTEDGPAPIPMMELPPAPPAVEEEEEVAGEEAAVVPPPAPEEAAAEEAAAAPSSASVSSNAYASGSNQNSGNFMTGRPTTRVRAPPGGASSITFG